MDHVVLIRCPSAGCDRLTGWTYPSFAWAHSHVPGLPSRCYVSDRGRGSSHYGTQTCPDPFGHVNAFLASRGRPLVAPESKYAEPEEEPEDPAVLADGSVVVGEPDDEEDELPGSPLLSGGYVPQSFSVFSDEVLEDSAGVAAYVDALLRKTP